MAKTELRSGQISDKTLLIDDLRDFAPSDGGGLDLSVAAGRIRNNITITDKAAQTVSLTASTTNYVELDSLGVASANTSAFTASRIPVAQVVTGVSTITTIADKRTWVVVVGAEASPTVSEGARVYNSANISISNNAWTSLTFNTERFDDNSFHSTVSNTSRLTAPGAGLYLIWGNVEWAVNATGNRNMRLLLNGTTVIAQVSEAATGEYRYQVSTIYSLSASDYIELQVLQTSGGALNAVVSGNWSPEFAMVRVFS